MLLNCGVGEGLSPLESKGIQPVHPKGNQSWIFIGRTDAEDETPILWPPDAKNWLVGKDIYTGKDWGQEEKGTTHDEMVGWHHWLNGHEFEQTLGVGDGQGSLACFTPWGCKESDVTEKLNWTELIITQTHSESLVTYIFKIIILPKFWVCDFLGHSGFNSMGLAFREEGHIVG